MISIRRLRDVQPPIKLLTCSSLEARLIEVMNQVHLTLTNLESRLKAEGFKQRVLKIFKAWEDWAVYPRDFLFKLRAAFLGTAVSVIFIELNKAFLCASIKCVLVVQGLKNGAWRSNTLLKMYTLFNITSSTPIGNF